MTLRISLALFAFAALSSMVLGAILEAAGAFQ